MKIKRAETLVLCLGAALALTGCTRRLDLDKLKTELKAGLTSQLGVTIKDVTCPEDREIKVADTFECKASSQGGASITLKVTQNDDQGNVKWEVAASEGLMDLKKLEAVIAGGLQEQAGVQAKVDCGGTYREAEPGKAFDCAATDPTGSATTVTVTVKDRAGNVDWKLNAPDGEPPAEE